MTEAPRRGGMNMADGSVSKVVVDTVDMVVTLERVTPEMAKEYMTHLNGRNRPMSKALVKKYAADRRAGLWSLTHQGGAFASDGSVLDGQHRFAMVVETGEPMDMLITRYRTKEASDLARAACDTGRGRSPADVETMAGNLERGEAKDVMAVLVAIHTLGARADRKALDTATRTALLHKYVNAARWARSVLPRASGTVRAAFALAWTTYPEETAEFAKGVAEGVADKGSALATWHRKVADGTLLTNGGTWQRRSCTLRALRILRAYIEGEGDLDKIYVREDSYEFFLTPPKKARFRDGRAKAMR